MKKLGYFIVSLLLAFGVFYSGYLYGENDQVTPQEAVAALGGDAEAVEDVDFTSFWKAWNVLEEKHIQDDDVTSEEKVYGAIQGLAASLDDPYTRFFPPQEAKQFQDNIEGKFGGVGMEVGIRDEVLTVVAPLPGTPAANAGVKSGDKIVAINGSSTQNMSVDEAVSLIRGEKGTNVDLTIQREGRSEALELSIERGTIEVPNIETEDLGNGILKVNVYQFSADAPKRFREVLREFQESGKNKLILDLRGNPGGFLEVAVDMSSWFLPSGKVVVKETMEGEESKVYRSKGYDVFDDDLKMAILVNEGTASAAEIMAAALSEHGVATLVGAQTFGKGSVQELVEITPETALKVTVAQWITPNGTSFSETGLEPDVVVEADEEDYLADRDPQLDRAIEIVNQ